MGMREHTPSLDYGYHGVIRAEGEEPWNAAALPWRFGGKCARAQWMARRWGQQQLMRVVYKRRAQGIVMGGDGGGLPVLRARSRWEGG
jgi:hypothetical protein